MVVMVAIVVAMVAMVVAMVGNHGAYATMVKTTACIENYI